VKPKFVIAGSIIIVGLVLSLGFYFNSAKEEKNSFDKKSPLVNVTSRENENFKAKLGEADIVLEIASTPEARWRGLGGRDSLPQDQGMLFVFDGPARISFWMREMRFGLDFIWLRDNIVVEFTENVPPPEPGTADAELKIYQPSQTVDMVLEVNAGWVAKNAIKVGDGFQISQ
jgi:uncharacterized membrane protein (UPF0127 family)